MMRQLGWPLSVHVMMWGELVPMGSRTLQASA